MRTIKNLNIPQNSDAKFPFSTIKNETETTEGTPVIEEIYGDILTNIYKILQTAGIVPTATQDSDATQYQILEAIQKLPNVLNDFEHTLLLTDTVWSVPLRLQYLPNKFVFFARASEAFSTAVDYTFKGNDISGVSYPISCPAGFNSGDELMVVIDTSTVRVYPLSTASTVSDKLISISLGSPVQYNNTKSILSFENGKLYSDIPSVLDIESSLRTFSDDISLIVLQIFALKKKILCFTTNSENNYKFFQFSFPDLNTTELIDYEIPYAVDYTPYCYTDGTYVYISNNANSSADDFVLKKLNYDAVLSEMSDNSTITLESTFVKTTNSVLKSTEIITLIDGYLTSFSLTDETKTLLGVYEKAIGNLFYYKNSYYFGAGDIAVKWLL